MFALALLRLSPVHTGHTKQQQETTLMLVARYVKLFADGGLGEQVGIHVAAVYAKKDGQTIYT